MNPIRFATGQINQGLDTTVSPPWLLAPLNGRKTVTMWGGEGCTVVSRSPAIAEVNVFDLWDDAKESRDPLITPARPRFLHIDGKGVGTTFIDVMRYGKRLHRLEVSVTQRITLNLSFHYLSDTANHRTTRDPADIDRTLVAVNSIFEPQTNISFAKLSHFKLPLGRDLGRSVAAAFDADRNRKLKEDDFDFVTSHRDRKANINVFFAWELDDVTVSKGVRKVESLLGVHWDTADIIVSDWQGQNNTMSDAALWAHELGHALGVDDVRNLLKHRHYLLSEGTLIPKRHALVMRKVAQNILRLRTGAKLVA